MAVGGALVGCSSAPEQSQSPDSTDPTAPATPRPADRRIRYGRHPNQWADLYLPDTGTGHPVVVMIHGGGWTTGVDASEMAPFASDLVRDGIAVWNVEYRLLNGGGGWPKTFLDIATALDILPSTNRTALGGRLDLGNLITFGASAGGHLAAWAVSRHRIPKRSQPMVGGAPVQRPRGALSYAGVLDLHLDDERTGASLALMDGSARSRPDRFQAGSPLALLPTGVPVVCMHGDADSVIPIEHSRRYVAKAKKLGDPATLIELPNVDHNNINPLRVGEPLWTQVREQLTKLVSA